MYFLFERCKKDEVSELFHRDSLKDFVVTFLVVLSGLLNLKNERKVVLAANKLAASDLDDGKVSVECMCATARAERISGGAKGVRSSATEPSCSETARKWSFPSSQWILSLHLLFSAARRDINT